MDMDSPAGWIPIFLVLAALITAVVLVTPKRNVPPPFVPVFFERPEARDRVLEQNDHIRQWRVGLTELRRVALSNINGMVCVFFQAERGRALFLQMEEEIKAFRRYNLTTADLRRKMYSDFCRKFVGSIYPDNGSAQYNHLWKYLDNLITYQDVLLLVRAEERTAHTFTLELPSRMKVVTVRCAVPEELSGIEDAARVFFDTVPDFTDYSGASAAHLLEYHLRKSFDGARIRVFSIDFSRYVPPPPPPPEVPAGAVEISEGIFIQESARRTHIYLLGKSGQGKSTLMVNIARQDIEADRGLVFVDPHGVEADKLLAYVPPERLHHTVYFNPRTSPIGLSTLNAESEEEKALVVDDCLVLFRRLSPESWGPRMDAILRYTTHTLLEVPGATLLDIMRLLTDAEWRRHVLTMINKPQLTMFWENVYTTFPKDAANPILTRMALFQLSPFIANTLGSSSTFNFYEHLQSGGIFIANIAGIGEEATQLLGSVLVSQIQLVATRRSRIPEPERVPCYLFVDEFQNFQSSAFGKIIAESRKFKLHLTMGNQKLADLDEATYHSIEGVGTSIYFNLNPSDAKRVSAFTMYKDDEGRSKPRFPPDAFMDLSEGEVIIKPQKASNSFSTMLALPPKPTHNLTREIIARTQEKYRPRLASLAPTPIDDEPAPSSPPPPSAV